MSRLALIFLCCLASPAAALDFRENSNSEEIIATGMVEWDDAEKLSRVLTLEFKQRHRIVRDLATVSFDSPGGSLLGGIRLGYAMRKLGVHANVNPEQSCMSACALAFLGGQERTVQGKYGVHAASFDPTRKQSDRGDELDSIQYLGAITNAYVTEMTGKSDVALKALSTPAATIAFLSDPELVSMGVITIAQRTGQFGRPGFNCLAQHNSFVLSAICTYLDLSALDQELNDLYSKILKEGGPTNLAADQERWRRYRNSCINDDMPNGHASVVRCVREAYSVRRDQLMSVWLAISAAKSVPGSQNWRPIDPPR